MTNTLTNGVTVIDLGHITSYNPHDQPDVMADRMPLSGPSESIVFDVNGVIRNITIEGIIYGATIADIYDNFIVKIRTINNGSQTASTLHLDHEDQATSGDYTDGNISVYITDFNPTFKEGEVTICRYRITFVEGS